MSFHPNIRTPAITNCHRADVREAFCHGAEASPFCFLKSSTEWYHTGLSTEGESQWPLSICPHPSSTLCRLLLVSLTWIAHLPKVSWFPPSSTSHAYLMTSRINRNSGCWVQMANPNLFTVILGDQMKENGKTIQY